MSPISASGSDLQTKTHPGASPEAAAGRIRGFGQASLDVRPTHPPVADGGGHDFTGRDHTKRRSS